MDKTLLMERLAQMKKSGALPAPPVFPKKEIILISPGGKKYSVTVDDSGNLTTKVVEERANDI